MSFEAGLDPGFDVVAALRLPFFQRALIAGLLASIACGVVGSFVVVKRITSISGGLSHAAFGGIGLAFALGISPNLGAIAFAVSAGILLAQIYLHRPNLLEPAISTLWAGGMALGILLIALTPGSAPDLLSYLFGSILFVPRDFLLFALALDFFIVGTVALTFKELQATVFDETFARSLGIPVDTLFHAILVLTSLAVVVLIRVVGIILIIALLTVPAVIARQWCQSLGRMMWMATGIGVLSTTTGLFLSYYLSAVHKLDAPTGPLIVLFSIILYGFSSFLVRMRTR